MYNSGQMEMQSDRWMRGNTGDRPSFNVLLSRGFGRERRFQVFAMTKGLLGLDKGLPKGACEGPNGAVVAGAVMGGVVGAMLAHAVTSNSSSGSNYGGEERYDLCSEEELLELAASRKKSFVAFYDDIQSISLDAPGMWCQMFGDRRTMGWITLREKSLGKIAMEVRDASEMSVAIDMLPRRLGSRVQINLQLDPRTRTSFVRK